MDGFMGLQENDITEINYLRLIITVFRSSNHVGKATKKTKNKNIWFKN